jgi:hypothetical protein
MNKLRTVLFAVAVTAVLLGCGLLGTPAAPVDNVATIVASTMQALTPVMPAATATQPAVQGVPVSYKNVSFVLPAGLASDAAPTTVPQASEDAAGPWGASPEHIEFGLNNYSVPAKSFQTREIHVYPARDYADLNTGANITLQRLQALLADQTAPITPQSVPHVPYFNAAAMIAAQPQRIHFQDGDGIRIVSQYGQAVMPIANDGTFYQFIGLTSDGKYMVIAILPVQSPLLQVSQDPSSPLPPGGVPFPDMGSSDPQVFQTYYQAVTDKLDNADPASFQPSLTRLDALVQSIHVQP